MIRCVAAMCPSPYAAPSLSIPTERASMAEIQMKPRPPLAITEGRLGAMDGNPGLVVRPGMNFAIATILARRSSGTLLAERWAARYGITLPDGPRHHKS